MTFSPFTFPGSSFPHDCYFLLFTFHLINLPCSLSIFSSGFLLSLYVFLISFIFQPSLCSTLHTLCFHLLCDLLSTFHLLFSRFTFASVPTHRIYVLCTTFSSLYLCSVSTSSVNASLYFIPFLVALPFPVQYSPSSRLRSHLHTFFIALVCTPPICFNPAAITASRRTILPALPDGPAGKCTF